MEIKDIVCPIGDAMELKIMGIRQDSIFYYVNGWKNPKGITLDNGEHIILSEEKHLTKLKAKERNADIEFISAFTGSELGIMLPSYIECYRDEPDGIWYCGKMGSDLNITFGKTEAEARAKCLIYLIENKKISFAEINNKMESKNIIDNNF